MNDMSEYYSMLKEIKPKHVVKKVHKGNWTLTFLLGGSEQYILANMPRAIIETHKKKIKTLPQYTKGTFKIIPHKP